MLVVNLFGAPGAGKTTLAMLIASELKLHHPDLTVECPNEVAKMIVYDDSAKALNCQIYVAGNQFWQIARCEGHADIVVCDSPILLSYIYGSENDPSFPAATFFNVCNYYHSRYASMNILVQGNHTYETRARVHSKEQATRLHGRIRSMMDTTLEKYYIATPTREAAEDIAYIAACNAWYLKADKNNNG